MKRLWTAITVLGLMSATAASYGQNGQVKDQERERGSGNRTKENTEKSSDGEKQRSSSEQSDEIRLRYDDRKGSLKIEVDEEIRLRDAQNRRNKQPITRDGELELRYDTDRHDLKAAGKGTIDVERAANAMSRWWQSWWEEEKTARRSRQEGAESGARHFVREHDEDNDGELSRRELPAKHRKDFKQIDRNRDGYLSRDEVRLVGDELYSGSTPAGSSTARNQPKSDNQDQTWSQWWAAWWSSDESTKNDPEGMTMKGAREFIRKHDRNDDVEIMRSEMPDRMYDDFDRIDANDDRRLTASELAKHAPRAEQARSGDARRSR
ncbi:EF hand [Anatilimnocola aggregata]|uniref:EF hand n=1 Tax=Anatilimnocola aggregata TaxID=2528021 RepID=A0A517YEJ5_9BACT|nr:hypothetical protein [Anatilimnocola aggregata]QDU28665.1 EF hand [Anatilimnocola aggregata]